MQGYSASIIAPGSLGCKNPIRPVHCGFVYNPAQPGNLAPVGFLTSFFYVFVAKLGIFLALHTRFPGYSVSLAFLYSVDPGHDYFISLFARFMID